MKEDNNKEILNKKNIIIICILVIIIISILMFLKFYNSNVNKFKRELEEYNIEELKEIYKTTSSYDEKKKIENIFEEKLNDILNQFALNEKNYEETYENIEKYVEFSNFENSITEAKKKLEQIKESKDNFAKGQEAERNNNLLESIENYLKVIGLDTNNYKYAQKYINDNKNTLKDSILTEVDSLIKEKNYIDANIKLELLQKIFTNDSNINQKILLIKDEAKKQEIEKYKDNQEVSVISATKHKEWYSSTISGVQVIVKNNTSKVVKSYIVSVLAYDTSGYPLKIEYNDYEKLVKADGANIQPGETHGKDNYCDIYYEQEKISTALACVKQVEYYDGSIWENPYYEYWKEQYKEKPMEI